MASEGLVRLVWQSMAEPGEDLMAVGARRAARDEGAFCWRNAVIAELGGAVAGGLVAYRIGPDPEPLDDVPPLFRPLQTLENRALGTHYVNVLATCPSSAGRAPSVQARQSTRIQARERMRMACGWSQPRPLARL